ADWGFTLRKLLVLTTWLTILGFVGWLPDARKLRAIVASMVAALILFQVAAAMALTERSGQGSSNVRPAADLEPTIDRYATVDMSVVVLRDRAGPVLSDSEFFSQLWPEAWATDDRSLHAVPLRLSEGARDTSVPLPNVFIIVVDSLRPDYISPYNPDVTFTPA